MQAHFFRRTFFLPIIGLGIAAFLLLTGQADAKPPLDAAPTCVLLDPEFAKRLTPFPFSPGVVVCDPIYQGKDTGLADFSIGCARWLQLMVGGQPELGQTPSWGSLVRARKELKTPNLRLGLAEARMLVRSVGITHAAIGKISGTAGRCKLAYQLYAVPSGKAVGAPVMVSGSEEAVVASLPGLAGKLAAALRVASPRIPSGVGASPSDLGFLGHLIWAEPASLSDTQKARIRTLAGHVPIAGLMAINDGVMETGVEIVATVEALLTQAPDNPIVYSEIAQDWTFRMDPHSAELLKLCARYPHNYMLACGEADMKNLSGERSAVEAAAIRVVRSAPLNPGGWRLLGDVINGKADSIRHGRFYSSMSSDEADTVQALYPRWLSCAKRAVELDPLHEQAWFDVCKAATFNSDGGLADSAYSRASSLDPGDAALIQWGLQIYQPKWYDNPEKLEAVAEHAVHARYDSVSAALRVYESLWEIGKTSLARKLYDGLDSKVRAAIRKNPGDAQAHGNLALLRWEARDIAGALAECETYARLLPNNAGAHNALANALIGDNQIERAIAEYREAIHLDPENPQFYASLGYYLKATGRLDEAERILLQAIRIDPYLQAAHVVLGDVYAGQKQYPRAMAEYRRALDLVPDSFDAIHRLAWTLEVTGDYDGAIAAAMKAVELNENDGGSYNVLGDAYLNKKDFDTSVQMTQKALAINAKDPVAHENLGEAYIGQGKRKEARGEWKTVLMLEPAGTEADSASAMLAKYPEEK